MANIQTEPKFFGAARYRLSQIPGRTWLLLKPTIIELFSKFRNSKHVLEYLNDNLGYPISTDQLRKQVNTWKSTSQFEEDVASATVVTSSSQPTIPSISSLPESPNTEIITTILRFDLSRPDSNVGFIEPSQMWRTEHLWAMSRASTEITQLNQSLLETVEFIISEAKDLFAHEADGKLARLLVCQQALESLQNMPDEMEMEDESPFYMKSLASRVFFHMVFAIIAKPGSTKTKWSYQKLAASLNSESWRLLLNDSTMKENLTSWSICLLLHRSFGDEMGIHLPFYFQLYNQIQLRNPPNKQQLLQFLFTYFNWQTSIIEIEETKNSQKSLVYWKLPNWITYLRTNLDSSRGRPSEELSLVLNSSRRYFGVSQERIVDVLNQAFQSQVAQGMSQADLSAKLLNVFLGIGRNMALTESFTIFEQMEED